MAAFSGRTTYSRCQDSFDGQRAFGQHLRESGPPPSAWPSSWPCYYHSADPQRGMAQETRQQARNGEGGLLALAASVAGCILECFYTLIEYLTKFATVMMSITGACFRTIPACEWWFREVVCHLVCVSIMGEYPAPAVDAQHNAVRTCA